MSIQHRFTLNEGSLNEGKRMSTWERVKNLRSYFTGNISSSDPQALEKIYGPGRRASSKIFVNEDIALNYSAVWSAINLIAGDVSTTPCNLMRYRVGGGKDVYDDHYLYELMHDQPNPEMTIVDYLEVMMAWVLSWGNGYAEIVRDRLGRPRELWPIAPNRVRPFRERLADGKFGPLQYEIDGGQSYITLANMVHIHGLGWDGVTGYSVISRAREAIGLGLASERFGATFFGNGTTFGGVLSVDADIDEDQANGIRKSIEDVHASPDKAHKILVIPGGQKFAPMTIPPNDAQFLETRKFQVSEIARWFGVPPHKIGDLENATFSNIESQELDYYKRTLRRWYVRLEKEQNRKLIAPAERFNQFFKFNADAFLRGDIVSRYTALGTARDKGIINADEWRDMEDMNPQDGGQGKIYLVQQAQVPLNRMDELVDATIASKTAPKAQPAATPPPEPVDPNAARTSLISEERAIQMQERILDLDGELRAATARAEAGHDETIRLERLLREAITTRDQVIAERTAGTTTFAARAEADLVEARERVRDLNAALEAANRSSEFDRVEHDRLAKDLFEATVARDRLIASRDQIIAERTTDIVARADNAETELVQALERVHDLSTALEAATRSSEADRTRIEQLAEELRNVNAAREQAIAAGLASLRTRVESAEAALIESREQVQTLTADLRVASTRNTSSAEEIARQEETLRQAVVRNATLEGIADGLRAQFDRVVEHQADLSALAAQAEQALRASGAASEAAVRSAEAEREAIERAETALERTDELERELVRLRDAHQRALADAEARIAAEVQRRTDAEANLAVETQELQRQVEAEAARAEQIAGTFRVFRDGEARRHSLVVTARREAVVDVIQKKIDREIEELRKISQSSPQKMRQKMDGFFERHQIALAQSLKTIARIHLAAVGSNEDARTVADRWATEHVTHSRAEILNVLDRFPEGSLASEDSRAFASEMNQMFLRWERERASTLPDLLLTREIEIINSGD